MALLTLGLSHHSAPLDTRERLAFTDAELPAALTRLRALPGVEEAAILSTCNRTEIFAVAAPEDESRLIEWWRRERQAAAGIIEPHLFVLRDQSSVLHSLRVASGLDSMVVGEPQILGQMKQAYAQAREVNSLGPVLSRLFQHTFAVAKLVRSRTQIGAHPVSIAYAAVQLAQHIFSDLSTQTALLIGAGDTVQLLARHLKTRGVGRIIVANRSIERAQVLAASLQGYAIGLNVGFTSTGALGIQSGGNQTTGISNVALASSTVTSLSSQPLAFRIVDSTSNYAPPGTNGTDGTTPGAIMVVGFANEIRRALTSVST